MDMCVGMGTQMFDGLAPEFGSCVRFKCEHCDTEMEGMVVEIGPDGIHGFKVEVDPHPEPEGFDPETQTQSEVPEWVLVSGPEDEEG